MLGDMGGLRPWLGKYGVTLHADRNERSTSPTCAAVSRRGARLRRPDDAHPRIDTQKAFGLPGGPFNVSALQIHGTQPERSTTSAR